MWWALGGLGLAASGWAWYAARRLQHPAPKPVAPPSVLPAHTRVALRAPDGAAYPVWMLRAAAPRARLILYHGYYASRLQVLPLAEALRQQGCDVLLPELRGHGERPGPYTFGVKETAEASVLLDWIRAQMPALPLGAIGWSQGAMVACNIAARHPEIRAFVADSMFPHFFRLLRLGLAQDFHVPSVPFAHLAWWGVQAAVRAWLAPYQPIALAPRMRQPLLAIQGGKDRWVRLEDCEAYYARWAGPKQQWTAPDVEHVSAFTRDPQAYVARVTQFFNEALGVG